MRVIKDRGHGLVPHEFDPIELARLYCRLPDAVVADLAELCFANQPTFDRDARIDARNQGRRDVWLHINTFLKLTPDQLEAIYDGRTQAIVTEEDPFNG